MLATCAVLSHCLMMGYFGNLLAFKMEYYKPNKMLRTVKAILYIEITFSVGSFNGSYSPRPRIHRSTKFCQATVTKLHRSLWTRHDQQKTR